MTSLQLGGYNPLDARLDEVTVAPLLRTGRGSFAAASGTVVDVHGARRVVASCRYGARPSRPGCAFLRARS